MGALPPPCGCPPPPLWVPSPPLVGALPPPCGCPPPPLWVPSPPLWVPSPPLWVPSPPLWVPSPPLWVPSPPLWVPSPPLWAPFVGYFGVRIKMRLPCRINNVVCLSSNRCGIVLRAPCPRSSVDRASASGAGSTGSNPVGGTFWRSETLSLLFFYLLRPSTKQVLLRRTLDRTRRRVHRVRPRITADDRRRAALAALTHHQRRR